MRTAAQLGMGGDGWTELSGVARGKGAQQVRGSATSGFPVSLSGVGKPRAAFLKESRIRGRWLVQRVGNPEYAPTARRGRRDDKVKGNRAAS